MKRSTPLLASAFLASFALLAHAQWQAQPQVDPRVGPVYPVNPAFNFQSRSGYDPYQFNWYSGRWDYVPIPYNSAGYSSTGTTPEQPYPYNPGPQGQTNYSQGPSHTVNSEVPTGIPPTGDSAPKPDDTPLWSTPATRPEQTISPKIVKFEGTVVAIKAVDFASDPTPHLLLRLRNDAGAMGTADVGQRLMFTGGTFDPKGHISVTGQLGVLDGRILLFANQISFGSQTINIDRPGDSPPK